MVKRESALRYLISAATVLLLILLAWQCLDIYITGNSPANLDESGLHIQSVYRAEDVSVRLKGLAVWAAVYAVLLVGASVLLPAGKPALPGMDPDNRLRLMKKKLTALPEEAQKQEALRKKIRLGTVAAVSLCALLALGYLLNRENFVSWDLETVMGQMLLHTLPWAVAAFAVLIAAAFACRRSMETEIKLLRGFSTDGTPDPVRQRKFPVGILRAVLYLLAVVFVVLGIQNGGMRDVLVKAINICTECIGLG